MPETKPPPAPNRSPVVALVGRPNVGKSSLFNAILHRRTAIVSDVSGTTRDRVSGAIERDGRRILFADTGGLVPEPESEIEAHIAAQVGLALAGADVVVFVVDVTQGVTPTDQVIGERLRRSGLAVVLAANKADTARQSVLVSEFYELGLTDPIPVSAYHRTGVEDILDEVVSALPQVETLGENSPMALPTIAIVGRPNVGKSSLINALLGEERSIVSSVPGTTRDAIDSDFEFEGQRAALIDTAGIRRRGSIEPGIERYSVLRSMSAIDRSDVTIVVLDATEIATAQDLHIAGQAMESFKGVVVVVNKGDLLEGDQAEELGGRDARRTVLSRLHFMDYVPVVVTSALDGRGIAHMMRTALSVNADRQRWVPPAELTRSVMDAVSRHLPPKHGRRSLKIYRVKQESVGPPTFVFYCNNPSLMHFSYERYMENEIRRTFGFMGTHLRLEFRGKGKLHVIGGHRTGQVATRSSRPKRQRT